MHRVLTGDVVEADAYFIGQVLGWWNAVDLDDLRRIVLGLGAQDRNEVKRKYGGMAPVITANADVAPAADAALRDLTRITRLRAPESGSG